MVADATPDTPVAPATAGTPGAEPPRRFRAAPRRNAAIARPLALLAGVRALDEDLLAELGRRMTTRDELAADLAAAMDRDAPGRVTMAQVHAGIAGGTAAVPDAPAPLRRFLDAVERTPDWVDPAELERGGRVLRRMAASYNDVLLGLSLIGGYRFGGPADLLVATGGLVGETAMRRLGETETWGRSVSAPGGMRRDGEGFRLTVHVRLMHALVDRRFSRGDRWDAARFGRPVNQTDVAATLGLFNATGLLGVRMLGWVITPAESRAVMALWRYVGWLMGVDEDWLFTTERAQHAFDVHVLHAQEGPTPAGAALAGALVDGQRTLVAPGRGARARGAWRRWRLLCLLRWFLGADGLRDLQLSVPSSAATAAVLAPIVARNLVASTVVARTRRGRRWLEARGEAWLDRELVRRFADGRPGVGRLPVP